jgi:hypothetical protein
MSSEEDKKEVVVSAPSKPIGDSEKRAEKIAQKALEQERYEVLQFPKKISKYFGLMVISTGALILFLFAYVTITGQTSGVLLSSETDLLSLVFWGFLGLINIVLGFIFLGRE